MELKIVTKGICMENYERARYAGLEIPSDFVSCSGCGMKHDIEMVEDGCTIVSCPFCSFVYDAQEEEGICPNCRRPLVDEDDERQYDAV